jgi:hypothetical protein
MTFTEMLEAAIVFAPHMLVALAFALNVADALLTDAIIARGGRESNPFMAFLMAWPLTRPLRWAIKLAVVVGYCWLAWPHIWALALFCAPFVWVVWHNARVLRRQLARSR